MSDETAAPVHRLVHTPGPWVVFNEKFPRVGPSHNCTVAGVFQPPIGDQKANAQLIAAAPELAEALRILYDFQNGPPLEKYRDQWTQAMELARSALDRASKL